MFSFNRFSELKEKNSNNLHSIIINYVFKDCLCLAEDNGDCPCDNPADLDDVAFDLFCTDEMPRIREKFAPINRRMSGEEMLDELLKRWELLSDD